MRNEYININANDIDRLKQLFVNDIFEVISIDLYNRGFNHKVHTVIVKLKHKMSYELNNEEVYIIEEYKFNDINEIEFSALGLLKDNLINREVVFSTDYEETKNTTCFIHNIES